MFDGLQGRMGRAETLALDDADMGGGGLRHVVHVGAEDDDDAVERGLAAIDQMAQHRAARDFMQRFRRGGFHAGAETGGEKNGGCLHAVGGVHQ